MTYMKKSKKYCQFISLLFIGIILSSCSNSSKNTFSPITSTSITSKNESISENYDFISTNSEINYINEDDETVLDYELSTNSTINNTPRIIRNDKDIKILYVSDVHCCINENIGYAGLKEYKKQLEEKNYLLTVDCGDFILGSPIGSINKGKSIAEIMNKVGFDFVNAGEHDFSYGISNLQSISDILNSGIFSSNIQNLSNNKNIFPSYKMFTLGNVKIALIAATSPKTVYTYPHEFNTQLSKKSISLLKDEDGKILYSQIQKNIDAVKNEGADFVILISHLGYHKGYEQWSVENVIKNTSGIDAAIDGSSHKSIYMNYVKNKEGVDTLLTNPGAKLTNVGEITITKKGLIVSKLINKINKKDGSKAPPEYRDSETVPEDFNIFGNAQDIEMLESIKSMQKENEALFDTTIASCSNTLSIYDKKLNRIVRTQETQIGNLIADAIKDALDSEVALVCSSSIRNSLPNENELPEDPRKKAIKTPEPYENIRYKDIANVLPTNEFCCLCEMKGQTLKDMLEFSIRKYPNEFGAFFQVSGIKFNFNTILPSNVKADINSDFKKVDGDYKIYYISINGYKLDPEKTYKVALSDFLIKQYGEGYSMLKDAKILRDDVCTFYDALSQYIKKYGVAKYDKLASPSRIIPDKE